MPAFRPQNIGPPVRRTWPLPRAPPVRSRTRGSV